MNWISGAGGSAQERTGIREFPSAMAVGECRTDDLAAAAWVQAFDSAWLGRDWRRLEGLLVPDVELLLQDSGTMLLGRPAVIAFMRDLIERVEVHEYSATGLRRRRCRAVSLVSYRWQLDWTANHRRRTTEGRDMLALRELDGRLQLAWRIQFGPSP